MINEEKIYPVIIGYKGGKGGGGGRTPKEDPDNLRSHAFARLIDLISEGEIGGLVDGLKSIYLDNTAVENEDGTFNFEGFEVLTRNGTQSQRYMKGFPSVEKDIPVAVRVQNNTAIWVKSTAYALNAVRRPTAQNGFEYKVTTAGTSAATEPTWPRKQGNTVTDGSVVWTAQLLGADDAIERTITDTNRDAVRVTASFPQLTSLDTKTGDLHGTTVEYAIDLQSDSGGWVPQPLQLRSEKVGDINASTAQTSSGVYAFNGGLSWEVGTYISPTPPEIEYRIDYKESTSGTWIPLKTGTLVAPREDSYGNGRHSYNPDYAGKQTKEGVYSIKELDGAKYDIRIVKVSGTGTLNLYQLFQLRYKTTAIVDGKATSKYQKSHRIELEGDAPWDIRFRRITPDSELSSLSNETWFESYTELTDAKLRYPNSAMVGMVIDSVNFSRIPVRGYDVKLLIIKVPSNYNPETRVYTGSWDGEFKVAWSDNPAWCFYDLITNDRYGLGKFISEEQIDKWALYTIGRYCDELVDNGFGGTEPRFTCNLYLQTREEAFKVIQDMASIFRGMAFWGSNTITAFQDSPSDPVMIFTCADVVEGLFQYSGSDLKTRKTAALVTWNDPADFYKQKIEYVEDATAIAQYGLNEAEIVAFGCTSRGQAHRLGKWYLYTQNYEGETVTFKTGLRGAQVRPGQIIMIQDRDRAGARMGGLLVSGAVGEVELDLAPTLDANTQYTLYCMLPDGTMESALVVAADGNVLTLATNFSQAPQTNAVWGLASSSLTPQTFRVVMVVETEDGAYEINGVRSDEDKYNYVERNVKLTPNKISVLADRPAPPIGIKITETLYDGQVEIKNRISLGWTQQSMGVNTEVSYRRNNGNWTTLPLTSSNGIDINDAQPGDYNFKLVTVSSINKRSVAAYATATIVGKTARPADVEEFAITPVEGGLASFSWKKSEELDVLVGGNLRMRYTSETSPASVAWDRAVDIGVSISGAATQVTLQHSDGAYLAKFVDSSGFESVNAVTVYTTVARLQSLDLVQTLQESPLFEGVKTNCYYNPENGGLMIEGSTLWDDMTELLDDWPLMDSMGGIQATATYAFADTVDLGATYDLLVTSALKVVAVDTGDYFDSRELPMDEWGLFDGDVVNDVNAKLYIRTTNDDPSGTPTWSDWRPFFTGHFRGRGFQFKLELTSNNPQHNIAVTECSVTLNVPERVEGQRNISSGTSPSGYAVTYPNAFWTVPSVGMLLNNMASGDRYAVSGESETGFTITFYNSGGTVIDRTFGYVAKGFGYKH